MPRRKQIKKKPAKNSKLILVIKINAILLAWLVIIYLLVGLLVDPSFFRQDLRNKYAWAVGASSQIALVILNDAPDKPAVSASSSCAGANPRVALSWPEDEKASSYDVYRNGELLFSDYDSVSFTDENVSENTTYTYYVTAKGLGGSTQSDTVNVQTAACATPAPQPEPTPFQPEIKFNTIDGIKITDFICTVKTDRKRPVITGTTNIPNATVYLELVRIKKKAVGDAINLSYRTVLYSTITANSNGYWSWGTPDKIKRGRYFLYASVINPGDGQTAETSLRFNAVKKCKPGSRILSCPFKRTREVSEHREEQKHKPGAPITITNEGNIEPGEEINVNLPPEAQEGPGEIRIENPSGEIVYQGPAAAGPKCQIKLPTGLAAGVYKLILIIKHGDECLTWETWLALKDKPAVNFGGSMTITWNDILGALSAVVIVLFGILVFFLSMLFIEHLLAKRRLYWVDEFSLKNKKLIR